MNQNRNLPGPDILRIDILEICIDSMVGVAWLFLVGGLNCLVHSANEQDPDAK